MASKKALLGGMSIKVENMSGFDKSALNAFTAPLGAIVPIRRQLCLPGNFVLRVKLSATLPPLATDAFLRTHLKIEAFLVSMRICYGGFSSWFSGTQVWGSSGLQRAKLPRLVFRSSANGGATATERQNNINTYLGPHSLADYFDVHLPTSSASNNQVYFPSGANDIPINIFPFIAYQLCFDNWYRNKLVERQLFAPLANNTASTREVTHLPFTSYTAIKDFVVDVGAPNAVSNVTLLYNNLLTLQFRNYGDDYFTTALPSAQEGSPVFVDTSSGSFTISALRNQNALQHFAEINALASPDYVATNKARYGVDLSDGVAQKPILLGSADFPMYSSGVEQTAQGAGTGTTNPFGGVGARYGRAHAEGSNFVANFRVTEPSYLMVMCSLVPEASYSNGIAKDMKIFTEEGSLVDLPVASLEQTGFEPVMSQEVSGYYGDTGVFGYQPRYMWHKAGPLNSVHGLLRRPFSLSSFAVQRGPTVGGNISLSTNFLKVTPSDLDNVMAVSGSLSQYGVIVDSSVELYCSEPLGESKLPSLADPAYEHGKSVYLRRGGNNV